MGKVLVIDNTKCNGCYNCQLSCKDEHVANDWTPIAKPQPNTGHFWYKISEIVQGSVPKVRVRYMHELCQHCDDAPCMKSCSERAIYKRDDGIVIIDPEEKTAPRVYYINLPNKFFVAGEVYDPVADECLEGAEVTLFDAKGKKVSTLETDVFGDFWFERNEPGIYSLKIKMKGYADKTIEDIDATKDINVGGIELSKSK